MNNIDLSMYEFPDITESGNSQTENNGAFALPSMERIVPMPSAVGGYTAQAGVDMQDYLGMSITGGGERISSGVAAVLMGSENSELSLLEYINKGGKDGNSGSSHLMTGIMLHLLIEYVCNGKTLEEFMERFYVLPKTDRRLVATTISEITFYCSVLDIDVPVLANAKISDLKELADKLQKECEGAIVSESDHSILRKVYAELLRRIELDLWYIPTMHSEITISNNELCCRPDGLLFYQDDNGFLCCTIVSIKTTANLDRVQYVARGYMGKEAHYRYCVSECFGIPLERVFTRFVFISTSSAPQIREVVVSFDTAERYNNMYGTSLGRTKRCIETNTFRGFEACELLVI